jgi:ABC-type nitrate/sulfonate/bicarbonate transport system permease component
MENLKPLFTPFDRFGPMKMLATGQAVFLLALWFVLPSTVLPSPKEILEAWNSLATNEGLLPELVRSITTIWEAIFYSTVISFGIAYLSTVSFFRPIAGWLSGLRFLGFAGITFLFTIWTSSGSELKISLLTFGMTVFLLTNMLSLVQSVPQSEIDYAKTLHLGGWKSTWELIVMGRLAESIDLVRQNAAMGWTLVTLVEGLVRAEGGIGDMLLNENKHFHLASIFAIQITILLYGLLQDYGLRVIRDTICPYVKFNGGAQ